MCMWRQGIKAAELGITSTLLLWKLLSYMIKSRLISTSSRHPNIISTSSGHLSTPTNISHSLKSENNALESLANRQPSATKNRLNLSSALERGTTFI